MPESQYSQIHGWTIRYTVSIHKSLRDAIKSTAAKQKLLHAVNANIVLACVIIIV